MTYAGSVTVSCAHGVSRTTTDVAVHVAAMRFLAYCDECVLSGRPTLEASITPEFIEFDVVTVAAAPGETRT